MRTGVQGQPGQKISKTPISTKGWAWSCVPVLPSYTEAEMGRIEVPAQPRGNNLAVLHLNSKSWEWWHVPVTPATTGSSK
jgi:hypothetical protein